MKELKFVLDVESIGLHGEGFAVGWVVQDQTGEIEYGLLACPPETASGTPEGREWVAKNVPGIEPTHINPIQMRAAFWKEWLKWKELGAVMYADVAWPVEARFLAACVDDDPSQREWQGPFPLMDVAAVLRTRGWNSSGCYARLPDELPEHNPLADARQSARLVRVSSQI